MFRRKFWRKRRLRLRVVKSSLLSLDREPLWRKITRVQARSASFEVARFLVGLRHFVVSSRKYKPDAQAREFEWNVFPRLRVGLVLKIRRIKKRQSLLNSHQQSWWFTEMN